MNSQRNKLFLLLLLSGAPVTESLLADIFGQEQETLLTRLQEFITRHELPFVLRSTGAGVRLAIAPEYRSFLQQQFALKKKIRLTRAAYEVLCIVAYRQPVTMARINELRAVHSEGPVHTLLDKQLIEIKGRKQTIGKPLLFGTSDFFLEAFGLSSLQDLPMHSEIMQMRVPFHADS